MALIAIACGLALAISGVRHVGWFDPTDTATYLVPGLEDAFSGTFESYSLHTAYHPSWGWAGYAIHAPFAALPVAYWSLLNSFVFAGLVLWLAVERPQGLEAWLLALAYPIWADQLSGHWDCLLAICMVGAFYFLQRNWILAGVFLGLTLSLKLTAIIAVIPIACTGLLGTANRRHIAGVAGVSALVYGVPMLPWLLNDFRGVTDSLFWYSFGGKGDASLGAPAMDWTGLRVFGVPEGFVHQYGNLVFLSACLISSLVFVWRLRHLGLFKACLFACALNALFFMAIAKFTWPRFATLPLVLLAVVAIQEDASSTSRAIFAAYVFGTTVPRIIGIANLMPVITVTSIVVALWQTGYLARKITAQPILPPPLPEPVGP